MEGEIWKDLKNYEGLYLVSNKGRVKQLASYKIYTDKIGRLYKCYQPEKILRQKVRYRLNKHINKTVCTPLTVRFSVDGIRITSCVSRLVYESFIGKIPSKGIIQYKDNDPKNTRVENLFLSTRKELIYKLDEQGLSNLLFSGKGVKQPNEMISKRVTHFMKEVSQYDLLGNRISTYRSIKMASEKTSISRSSISSVICGISHTAGGFIWRTEKEDKIDLSSLSQKKSRKRASHIRSIIQYTLKGKMVATYKNISEASRISGISRSYLYTYIKDKRIQKTNQSEYLWKYQEER